MYRLYVDEVGTDALTHLDKDNCAGLQLCDLLAHPSHIYVRKQMGHDVALGPFSTLVSAILESSKYDRSPWNGKVKGYGFKHQP